MKRYFFVLLFSLFATTSGAQVVTVPDDVARWFLEQDKKVEVLTTQVTTLKLEILSLKEQVKIKKSTVDIHVDDSKLLNDLLKLKMEQLTLKQQELRSAEREILKLKIHRAIAWIAAGTLAVLLAIVSING